MKSCLAASSGRSKGAGRFNTPGKVTLDLSVTSQEVKRSYSTLFSVAERSRVRAKVKRRGTSPNVPAVCVQHSSTRFCFDLARKSTWL